MPLLLGKINVGKCAVDGCENKSWVRGLCCAHYHRWYKYGDATHIPIKPPRKGKRTDKCKDCGKVKTIEARGLCKKCYMRQWSKNRPSRHPYRIKKMYGITIEYYNKILKKQKGLCAICGLPDSSKMLSIDHNHNTNKIRGLLCQRCNAAIGMLNVDNFGILNLLKSIEYLGK